jgi:hypothetical protein
MVNWFTTTPFNRAMVWTTPCVDRASALVLALTYRIYMSSVIFTFVASTFAFAALSLDAPLRAAHFFNSTTRCSGVSSFFGLRRW